MAKVFVGLSGGVDSSAAALLLLQAGHEVSGIHLQLLQGLELACSSPSGGAHDAAEVARKLEIPLHLVDLSPTFRETVVADFINEYEAGRTPNPCILCNKTIKFGTMLEEVLERGGEYIATGHYARIRRDPESGRYLLLRGLDSQKDQSYFLYSLSQEQLSRTLFPLGELDKSTVRTLAEQHGLITAQKRDSQDICFVPDGDYAAFIQRTTGKPSPTGDFLDEEGRVLGQHKGFIRYTRGQHKGLGLPTEQPLYVLSKDPDSHAIRLGANSALFSREVIAERFNWICICEPKSPLRVTAKIRHGRQEYPATVEPPKNGCVRIVFDEPLRAAAPGQSVVLYDGELVVGGGIICS